MSVLVGILAYRQGWELHLSTLSCVRVHPLSFILHAFARRSYWKMHAEFWTPRSNISIGILKTKIFHKIPHLQRVSVWRFMSAWTKTNTTCFFAVPWCNASHVIWWIVAYAIRERERQIERQRDRERGDRQRERERERERREREKQQQPSATAKAGSILRWATHWQRSVIQWTLQYACCVGGKGG